LGDKINRFSIISIAIFLSFSTLSAQDKGFGIGVILGEPTGLSIKFWTSYNTAVDIAQAWSFVDGNALHLHSDFLLHNFGLIKLDFDKLPIYYGIGGRIKFVEVEDNKNDKHKFQLGVRIPVGLNYLPSKIPFDFFFEIVPLLDLIPKTDFTINGGIGFRYFFQ
jgi:hypothetical protein